MLTEQLQKDIDLEAKAEAKKMTARVPIFRHGYEAGWYDAGEKYAELWQAAEERAERAEKALENIANPVAYLQRKADEEGGVLNGFAFQVASDPEFLKSIAKEALTPKTSTDELHKES